MNEEFGKKVFFLYPHSVIQDEMMQALTNHGYEVYLIYSHDKMLKLLQKFIDCILFINIDDVLQGPDWEQYIRCIQEDPVTSNVRIGILTYNEDKKAAKKYTVEIKVPCGYTRLKLVFKESVIIILKILEYNEARGRRRHIRAICDPDHSSSFNIKHFGKLFNGEIQDISIVGMACVFKDSTNFDINTYFNEIQLRLKGSICIVAGTLAMIRKFENQDIYIIMFEKKMSYQAQTKIYQYIHFCLQHEMEKTIKYLDEVDDKFSSS